MLFGMPFASTMGLLGSPKNLIIPFVLNRNGQAITLKKELASKGIKTLKRSSLWSMKPRRRVRR